MQTRFIKRVLFGAMGVAAALLAAAAQAAGVPGQGTWETTLQARDLDGNGQTDAFYDTELNVTWLRDADANGPQRWSVAKRWANNLDFGGYRDWRLPTMIDTFEEGCSHSNAGGTDCGYNVQTKGSDTVNKSSDTVYSEMAHLWYVALGNKAYCPPGDDQCAGGPQPGWGLTNTGNFQDMQSGSYLFGLEYARYRRDAWVFYFHSGGQTHTYKGNGTYALAVRPGDVGAVPEPQTYALLMLGLTALAVARRRR